MGSQYCLFLIQESHFNSGVWGVCMIVSGTSNSRPFGVTFTIIASIWCGRNIRKCSVREITPPTETDPPLPFAETVRK